MVKSLNIIALNIPYPPDYGGMIDTYYRIKSLHALGVRIYLHCFAYNRPPAPELEPYCEKIYYYERKTSVIQQLSITPFIVKSRTNKALLQNLLKNDYPVLFDGLHVAGFIHHRKLRGRKKILRAHNIEHVYYLNLTKNEAHLPKKIYFWLEAMRLKWFERKLSYAETIACVSTTDYDYFMQHYGRAAFIPSSHKYNTFIGKEGKGAYILYHGDLSVNENETVVMHILKDIAPYVHFPFIIAGKNPSPKLFSMVRNVANVRIIENPKDDEMEALIENAHIHLLPALRACGLKLKLLYALYAGRFCVVNPPMVEGTNLGPICEIASSAESFIDKLTQLIQEPFTQQRIESRKILLDQSYNPENNALKFIDLL